MLSAVESVAKALRSTPGKKDEKGLKNTENTLFVGLVSAIIMFKRLAKKIRARRRYQNQRKGVKSALFKKVQESNKQVRSALFGRPVINLPAEDIDEYREYMDRRRTEFKASVVSKASRRYATRPSTFAIPTEIAKTMYEHRNKGVPVVHRLRSLNSGHFNPDGAAAVKEVDEETGQHQNAVALTTFFESVVEKNSHMDRVNMENAPVRSGM